MVKGKKDCLMLVAMAIGSHQRTAALRSRSTESDALYLLPRSSTSTTLREDNPIYIDESDMQQEMNCPHLTNRVSIGSLHDSVVMERSMVIGAKVCITVMI